MAFRIHRPRQAVGLIYIVLYMVIFFVYLFILKDDRSWLIQSKFTVTVMIWFIISLSVKVSMFLDRTVELLNLLALLGFMSIGFTYSPPGIHPSSIQNFCYYLYFVGGSLCDLFDFAYEAVYRLPKDAS